MTVEAALWPLERHGEGQVEMIVETTGAELVRTNGLV